MLRLELRDFKDTVMFVNPMDGIEVGKEDVISIHDPVSGERFSSPETEFHLIIRFSGKKSFYNYYKYSSKEDRDTAYEYVLAKVNEYLFPQKEG